MVPFGGWEMPVQYRGILEEHRTVRAAVGCFDVSHMGEFEIEGPGALATLQRLTTNDVGALEIGQVQYSLLCKPDGGIVDDLTLYRLAQDRYLMVVNAGNIDKDWTHVTTAVAAEGARWRNASAATGLIAVQGPRAEALVGRLADQDVTRIGYYRCARGKVAGVGALISRTGYTGVDGASTGMVTSGTCGPSVKRSIAMAYLATAHGAIGTEIGVEIRGQAKPARVVKTPFHPSRVKKG